MFLFVLPDSPSFLFGQKRSKNHHQNKLAQQKFFKLLVVRMLFKLNFCHAANSILAKWNYFLFIIQYPLFGIGST
jgi:hypothetical protein